MPISRRAHHIIVSSIVSSFLGHIKNKRAENNTNVPGSIFISSNLYLLINPEALTRINFLQDGESFGLGIGLSIVIRQVN